MKSEKALRALIALILPALLVLACRGARGAALEGVDVPMRDGIVLKADVHLPDGDGSFPAVLTRTPYNRKTPQGDPAEFTARGVAFVSVDTRGRFGSQGDFTPLANEGPDGTDTLNWALAQPWCNGAVALLGGSYVGFTQWAVLGEPGPAPAALAPVVTTSNMYDVAWRDGAFNLATILGWSSTMHDRGKVDTAAYLMAARGMNTLPLTRADNKAGFQLDFYGAWAGNPAEDAFWAPYNFRDDLHGLRAPALLLAGWFDLFLGPQIKDFVTIQQQAPPEIAAASRLVIGPWDHSGALVSGLIPIPQSATLKQGEPAVILRGWYDYYLLGEDNPSAHMRPVRLYIMGADRWEFFDQWPPERARVQRWYLHSDGTAADPVGGGTLDRTPPAGAEPPDAYTYDPHDPAPSRGGTILSAEMGPQDYARVAQRPDVLSYTSAALAEPLTVAGPVGVTLHAATDACGTDFVARLLDVRPDGKAVSLAEGIVRTQALSGGPAQPGQARQYAIDLWATAYEFPAGHRVRVDVASAAFPHWDRNRNLCDAPAGLGTDTARAAQTVYHDAQRASFLEVHVLE